MNIKFVINIDTTEYLALKRLIGDTIYTFYPSYIKLKLFTIYSGREGSTTYFSQNFAGCVLHHFILFRYFFTFVSCKINVNLFVQ